MRSFCHSKIPVTATEFAIVFEAIPSVIMFMKGFNFYLNVFETVIGKLSLATKSGLFVFCSSTR